MFLKKNEPAPVVHIVRDTETVQPKDKTAEKRETEKNMNTIQRITNDVKNKIDNIADGIAKNSNKDSKPAFPKPVSPRGFNFLEINQQKAVIHHSPSPKKRSTKPMDESEIQAKQ